MSTKKERPTAQKYELNLKSGDGVEVDTDEGWKPGYRFIKATEYTVTVEDENTKQYRLWPQFVRPVSF